MALVKLIDDPDYMLRLRGIPGKIPDIAEKALRAGASIVANQMRINLNKIISAKATGELASSFGITPMAFDNYGDYNVHIGFDGYSRVITRKWNKGVPFQVIARSFESGVKKDGVIWRQKTPFAKPAVDATKKQVEETMKKVAEKEMEKLLNG